MFKHYDSVLSTLGEPISPVIITVTTYPGGAPVTLYDDDEITVIASCVTNSEGEYYFNVPAGTYTIIHTYNGVVIETIQKVSIGLSGTDLQGTGSDVDAAGFRGIPVNSQSADYTTVLADNGKQILHPAADNVARVFTIDMVLAYESGSCITVVNRSVTALTITGTTPANVVLGGTTTTGARTLAQNGVATFDFVDGVWIGSGAGLT